MIHQMKGPANVSVLKSGACIVANDTALQGGFHSFLLRILLEDDLPAVVLPGVF